jgi:hypothetical protein
MFYPSQSKTFQKIYIHNIVPRCDIYPTDPVIGSILLLSIVYNAPRFFDSTITYREDYSLSRVNDTGNPLVDQQLVKVMNQRYQMKFKKYQKCDLLKFLLRFCIFSHVWPFYE